MSPLVCNSIEVIANHKHVCISLIGKIVHWIYWIFCVAAKLACLRPKLYYYITIVFKIFPEHIEMNACLLDSLHNLLNDFLRSKGNLRACNDIRD
jgi:hypothetical protein